MPSTSEGGSADPAKMQAVPHLKLVETESDNLGLPVVLDEPEGKPDAAEIGIALAEKSDLALRKSLSATLANIEAVRASVKFLRQKPEDAVPADQLCAAGGYFGSLSDLPGYRKPRTTLTSIPGGLGMED